MSEKNHYYNNLFSLKILNPFDYFLISTIILISLFSPIILGMQDAMSVGSAFGEAFQTALSSYHFDVLGSVSAICGVLCVVLGAKGSMANWVFGIVECFLYTYICLQGHIYGDALQRIFYTLPMQFLGWYWWHNRRRSDRKSQIRTRFMTWRQRFVTVAVIAFLTFLIAYVLGHISESMLGIVSQYFGRVKSSYSSNLQLYMDSLSTVVAIVAMFISTKAYVEQWALWILVNIASMLIWYQNLGTGDPHAFMTLSKYVLYLVNSFYGFYMWRKLSRP